MRNVTKGKISARTIHCQHIEGLDRRLLLSTTFTVNNLVDETTPNDSLLSLREAITQANNTAGADAIVFSPALNGVIKLVSGQLEITSDMTITGPGAKILTVSGFSSSRMFHVAAGATASISGLKLIDGLAPVGEDGGGILNDGTLTLDRVLMNNNEAGSGARSFFDDPADPGGNGGAIYNGGTLTLTNSTIDTNYAGAGGRGYDDFASGGGGGDGGSGGGLYNFGKLVVKNSTFVSNQAGGGGFGGDGGFGFGGGGGTGGNGGAIANVGDATVIHCTLSDNFAGFGGFGGAGDAADGPRGQNGSGGGIFNKSAAQVNIGNTLIADNGPFGGAAPDVAGSFTSLGHNLVTVIDGSDDWVASDFTGDGNTPLDAKLGTYGDHGGPTPTIDLLAGSPALDHGDKAIASTYGLATDQRGFGRVYNGQADIGAVEQGSSYPGDANRDGKVDFADLVTLAQNYGLASGATWAKGDFTGDGKVDFADLVLLAQNYGTGTADAAAAAPAQPAAVVALAPQPQALLASVSPKKDSKSLFSVVKVSKPAPPAKRAHH